MKRIFSLLLLSAMTAAFAIFLAACSDDPEAVPAETGSFKVKFDNVIGTDDLVLNTGTYTNAAAEKFSISTLNYFISNIKFISAQGKDFIVPQDSSYFLIREANEGSQTITIHNVPTGDYQGVEFIIGVDSLRSVADESKRNGVLDKNTGPTNEEAMYWDWNPGYIFLKLEGNADSATSANGKFYYHTGGFGGRTEKTINNIRTAKIDFGSDKATVTPGQSAEITLKADILKVFNGPTTLSIKENTSVMFMPFSKNIADNYMSMFSLGKINNK
jgi:hypothetical protein